MSDQASSSPSAIQRMLRLSDGELEHLGVQTDHLNATLVLSVVALVLLVMLAIIGCTEDHTPGAGDRPGLMEQGIQQPLSVPAVPR